MKKLFIMITALSMVIAGSNGVFAMSSNSTPAPPPPAADAKMFDRYVSIGDSLTQGFMGVGVDQTRQPWAYPNRIAQKMGTDFNQALLKFPGFYVNIEDIAKGNIRWYQYYYVITGGKRVDNYDDQEILNNFAITGSDISTAQYSTGEEGGFYKLVLGKKGRPMVDQALDRKPTFATIFLGNNDLLGAALRCNLDELTPTKIFKADYARLVSRVRSELKENGGSIQGIAMANLPDVSCIAFLDADPNPDSPAGTVKPFFLYQSTETLRLTPADIEKIQERHAEFNNVIKEAALSNGWALVDVNETFTDIKENGRGLLRADGSASSRVIDAEYLGGLFSLDGVHPSVTGASVAANTFIEAINEDYGTQIGYVDEYNTSEQDTLYIAPYDPRTIVNSWIGKGLYFLVDLFA